MEGLLKTCSTCEKSKELLHFIGKKGQPCQVCQDCREKEYARVQAKKKEAETMAIPLGQKHCNGCFKVRDLDLFKGKLGQECNACQECRDRGARSRKNRVEKHKNAPAQVEGDTKICDKCIVSRPLASFIGARGHKWKLCENCRASSAGTKKRGREKDPERYRERGRKYLKKAREETPLLVKRREYRNGARTRGIEMLLTDDQMDAFFQGACHYCNDASSLNGIDRVDNDVGYRMENCVTCCTMCNYAKWRYTVDQFLTQCKSIAHYQATGQLYGEWPFPPVKRVRYNQYLGNAETRGLFFGLIKSEFDSIIAGSCHYCGRKADAQHKNGIDRKNSSVGYLVPNCVPCCAPCNRMKKWYNREEFIAQCQKVAARASSK